MTFSMILGVAIGLLFGWRIVTIGVRIWRAWVRAEHDAERKRLDRIIKASTPPPPQAPGLRRKRVS